MMSQLACRILKDFPETAPRPSNLRVQLFGVDNGDGPYSDIHDEHSELSDECPEPREERPHDQHADETEYLKVSM